MSVDVNESFDRIVKADKWVLSERTISIDGERLHGVNSSKKSVQSLLSALRHINELHFATHECSIPPNGYVTVQFALFASLQHFKQLRSLHVGGVHLNAAPFLAAALNSLPSLTSLELHRYENPSDKLTAALHRLCSTQLHHLTLSCRQLHFLVQHRRRAVMPRLRSLAVSQQRLTVVANLRRTRDIDGSFAEQFPSLLHLTVHCPRFMQQMSDIDMPQLSSLTLQEPWSTWKHLTHINTRTFRVMCRGPRIEWTKPGAQLRTMLDRAPRMQHLSLSDHINPRTNSNKQLAARHIFGSDAAATSSLSNLVHLDFLDGLSLADLTFLLTPTAPPAFAARLTHLALRVHWQDRAASAVLLPMLPSVYATLTHVHIGVQSASNNEQVDECAEWDSAVEAVRAAVGSAWCDSVDDVLACREDVIWRHSAGLPVLK